MFFQKLTTENGISHNKINRILQDKRGFIWIGTDDGLNRYDGNKFLVFRNNPSDSTSLTGNIITDILEDKQGVLWIATADGGLASYDYRLPPREQFHQYRHSDEDSFSIPVNIINGLLEDEKGYLWLATSGFGLLRFDKQNRKFQQPFKDRARTVLDLALDKDGVIWAGRQGGGLLRIQAESLRAEVDDRYDDVYTKLPHMVVTSVFRDSKNNMWLGSWDKLVYKYAGNEKNVSNLQPDKLQIDSDDALSFAEDASHRIWIGGRTGGVYIFDPASKQYFHYNHDPARDGTLADNQVNCVYIDRSGVAWLGTNRGVSVYDPDQQQFVQTFLPDQDRKHKIIIYDFYRKPNGELMIGTSDGLFIQQLNGSMKHLPLTFGGSQLSITRFYKSSSGQLYLGTDVSLFLFDEKNGKLNRLPNTENDVVMNRIIESRVVSVQESKIGNHAVLLVAPYGHFFTYYDFVTKKWVNRQDSVIKPIETFNLKDHLIRKFYQSRKGTIWIATSRFGLGEWHNGMPIAYYSNRPNKAGTLTNNNVFDICEDVNGNLWVSTYGGGLHYFNTSTKEFQQVPSSYNLAEGIQLDSKQNLWMIANGALHKFDIHSRSFTSYQLPDLEKTGGPSGYIYKDELGKFYVAGLNYFIRFHPDSIREIAHEPRVYLTDFKIFNESYSHLLSEKEIRLKYNKNYLSFEFSAPTFSSGHPVQYAYLLQGVDPTWKESGSQNVANYTNLGGGDYVFKVRATTKPGVWSNEITSIHIKILPPFWNTLWFYAIVVLISTGAVFAMYRYRINELLKRQAIRDKIAQDIHDNVGSTLSSISVYSQVAKIQNSKGNTKALDDILVKIAAASSEMISDMNDIVWTINPRNDSMEKIVQRMESYARPLLNAAEIHFMLHCDPTVLPINLDMASRKNFYLIFKEAIHNGLKYAQCKKMEVTIKRKNHRVELIVKDDGIGFNQSTIEAKAAQSLSGNGLRNLRMRTGEMKGECTIESAPGKGTMVSLRFPYPN